MIFIILAIIFSTSLLSGLLGMGGGMILAGLLALILPLPVALFLHAATQFTANTYRCLLLKNHIQWVIVLRYAIGLGLVLLVFQLISVQLSVSVFYLLLGTIALTSFYWPKNWSLDITNSFHAILSGVLVSALHLFVGVAGPLLDVFYQRSPLNRYEIVATKAATQSLGHFARIGFYMVWLLEDRKGIPIEAMLVAGAVVAAVIGTHLGKKLLTILSEQSFRRYSQFLLSGIGVLCLWKGSVGLLAGV